MIIIIQKINATQKIKSKKHVKLSWNSLLNFWSNNDVYEYAKSFVMSIYTIVRNLSLIVDVQVQNYSFRPVVNHKFRTDSLDELGFVIGVLSFIAIDTEVNCSQSLYCWIVCENTDIGPRSQWTYPIDKLNIVSLKEYDIGLDLEW